MGCRALGDADYMESLSIYIDDLLQDPSLRVRRAIIGGHLPQLNLKNTTPLC